MSHVLQGNDLYKYPILVFNFENFGIVGIEQVELG